MESRTAGQCPCGGEGSTEAGVCVCVCVLEDEEMKCDGRPE